MAELSRLKGLGPKSEQALNRVGIHSEAELRKIGAIGAFLRLAENCDSRPSLNFLYALIGALEGEHWLKIVKSKRAKLLIELENYRELEALFRSEAGR